MGCGLKLPDCRLHEPRQNEIANRIASKLKLEKIARVTLQLA